MSCNRSGDQGNQGSEYIERIKDLPDSIRVDDIVIYNLFKSQILAHQGIGFGGCSSQEFCFELNNTDYDVAYTIEKGIPHELHHLANEAMIASDPSLGTALFLTIDEGFACYFTWAFFEGKITKWEAVENMEEKDWDWYLQNEKDIFTTLKPYFDDSSGDNPLLRNDIHQLYPEAPKTLYYWLGFRIVERYTMQHGEDSWKDLYGMNACDILERSGYEENIRGLN